MKYERYYYMPMPVNKDGNGPADADDTARTLHEVWDDACLTVCTCADEATARHIAAALNDCPVVAPQQAGTPAMADVAAYGDWFSEQQVTTEFTTGGSACA